MNFFFKTARLSCVLLAAATAGCSSVDSSMSNINLETPYAALTSLTETLACMGEEINKSDSRPILLLVDDFYDGTVPLSVDGKLKPIRENGPLADAGKYDFEAVIKRSISNAKIVIPYSMPSGLLNENIYGQVNIKYLYELQKIYGVAAIIKVKGVFTQNDSSDYYNRGFGDGAGVTGQHGQADIEYGLSESSRSLSLAIYLGEPIRNIVGAATTLTLNTHTRSDQFSVALGYGEGFVNFAKESKLKEGLHGAQRTLVEAAAMWTLRGIYRKLDFSRCFCGKSAASPDKTVTAYQKWRELTEDERIQYLKLMLEELGYVVGRTDEQYDFELQRAIAAYEQANNIMIPHTRSNLGELFILIYPKVDFDKIEKLAQKPAEDVLPTAPSAH